MTRATPTSTRCSRRCRTRSPAPVRRPPERPARLIPLSPLSKMQENPGVSCIGPLKWRGVGGTTPAISTLRGGCEGGCEGADTGADAGAADATAQHAAARPAYPGEVKILAAMSGGVDSAVAAARAVEAGHEVVGVHLALSRNPGTLRTGSRGCCTIEDAMDARRAAAKLGIPFYVWDFSERFRADVIDDFVAEYAAGRTPNPCMRCNERIKFAALLEKALALGFDAVC